MAGTASRARPRRAAILLVVPLLAAGASVTATAAPVSPAPAATFWGRAVRGDEAPAGGDEIAGWFSLAVARTTEGRYAEAAAAYGEALAAGAVEPSLYANLGEVLMADGQLGEAAAAYRDAVAAAEAQRLPAVSARLDGAREHAQDLALGLLGLAVALDRDGQAAAARETMRRALALEASASVLAVATVPNDDLFFVPVGDIHYYVGLARAVAGRRDEAAEAFRTFLAEAPASRWAARARAHLEELARGTGARALGPSAPRVLAAGTVLATGGAAAPLIDAAWRDQAAILDDCLDAAPDLPAARLPVRIAIELEIDTRGRITAAAAKLPAPLGAGLGRCLEQAVIARLRLPPSAATRPTRARTELLVGFPSR